MMYIFFSGYSLWRPLVSEHYFALSFFLFVFLGHFLGIPIFRSLRHSIGSTASPLELERLTHGVATFCHVICSNMRRPHNGTGGVACSGHRRCYSKKHKKKKNKRKPP